LVNAVSSYRRVNNLSDKYQRRLWDLRQAKCLKPAVTDVEWPAADPVKQMLVETGDDLRARPPIPGERPQLTEEFVGQSGTVGMF
jgi:hypothetical protein